MSSDCVAKHRPAARALPWVPAPEAPPRRRPSARATALVCHRSPAARDCIAVAIEAASIARGEAQRARCAEDRQRVVAVFEADPDLEWYSVELARMVGGRIEWAHSLLLRLERHGVLTSRLEESPHSGNGRRYFRLRRVA